MFNGFSIQACHIGMFDLDLLVIKNKIQFLLSDKFIIGFGIFNEHELNNYLSGMVEWM